jgi:phosphatidylethanolamine/phosphatidyl-N-methylethanolamine N-methyltransferase
LVASSVDPGGSTVLEIGPGTGSITQALLQYGIAPDRLFLIERDPALATYLRKRFPDVRVRCADAAHALRVLRDDSVGQVKTIVSSLPLRNLPPQAQLLTMRAILKALAPGGQLLQFSYSAGCPSAARRLGLHVELVGRVWRNLPPASVWRFTRTRDASPKPPG